MVDTPHPTDNRPTPTLWSVVEQRLFRPCGQHNQTDNRPTPTLWSVVEHNAFHFSRFPPTPRVCSAVEQRLFRPRGQHNPTDNRPTPTLWRVVQHNCFHILIRFSNNIWGLMQNIAGVASPVQPGRPSATDPHSGEFGEPLSIMHFVFSSAFPVL